MVPQLYFRIVPRSFLLSLVLVLGMEMNYYW
jgi:hypothetical protein